MRKTYPRYESLPIRLGAALVGAFIVSRFGGNDTILSLLLTPDFYVEYGVTLLITFLVIQMVYLATTALDRRFDWHQKTWQRVTLQALLGILVPTLVTFLIAAFYFSLYDRNILETNYHLYALPFIVALIAIGNLYYYIRYLLAERAQLTSQSAESAIPVAREQSPPLTGATGVPELPEPEETTQAAGAENGKSVIMVHTPTRSFPMQVAEIAYFYRDQGRVFLRPYSGNDQILSQSLDAIEQQLDKDQFFRAARHVLVNRASIEGYTPLNHGKLGLILYPAFKQEVNVSKPMAKTFKGWLDR